MDPNVEVTKALTQAVLSSTGMHNVRATTLSLGSIKSWFDGEQLIEPHSLYDSIDIILTGGHPELGLESLNQTKLLSLLFPGVIPIIGFGGQKHGHKDLWEHTKQVVAQTPPRRATRIAALYHDVGKPKTFRRGPKGKVSFHMHEELSVKTFIRDVETLPAIFPDLVENNRIARIIGGLGQVESYNTKWSDTAVRRIYNEFEDIWSDLIDVALADVTSAYETRRERARNKTRELTQRVKEVIEKDRRTAETKLPKGLGTLVAQVKNIKGRELGAYIRFMQSEVETGRLPIYSDPTQYDNWIREHHNE
jgi:poly(A) polymerase